MDLENIKKILKAVYKDVDAFDLSLKAQNISAFRDDAYQYGGATIESYVEILTRINPKDNLTFIDLGSGIGEKVLITALAFPQLKQVIGVEELHLLYTTSVYAQKTLSLIPGINLSQIVFVHKNYFNVSLHGIDFVYISIHPPTLQEQLNGALLSQLNTLKKGSRVLLTQVPIQASTFTLLQRYPYEHKFGQGNMYLFEKI